MPAIRGSGNGESRGVTRSGEDGSHGILSTQEFYDALAPAYDQELEYRSPYVRALNDRVSDWARSHECNMLLDVGCANGARSQLLLEATGLKGVCFDLSPVMVQEARRRGLDAHVVDISEPSINVNGVPEGGFDVITCFWMLGHLKSYERRRRALENMRALVAPGGALILDVNNPYNAAEYGWGSAARNLVRNTLRSRRRGDFVAKREVAGRKLTTFVHLFSRREILHLCRDAGLTPVDVTYVSYKTGDSDVRPWSGQICLTMQPETV
jgi:SAM-dependent methyltransferase